MQPSLPDRAMERVHRALMPKDVGGNGIDTTIPLLANTLTFPQAHLSSEAPFNLRE